LPSTTTGKYTIDTPQDTRAFDFLKQLYAAEGGYTAVNAFANKYSTGYGPFPEDVEAMQIMGEFQPSYMPIQAPNIKYSLSPLPVGPGVQYGSVTYLPSGNFFVLPKGATHLKASLTFLTWMASPYAVEEWCSVEGNIPPTPAVTFGAFDKAVPKDREFVNIIKNAKVIYPTVSTPTATYFYNTFTTISEEILEGSVSVSAGLSQFQEEMDQQQEEFNATHHG
jgi:ABC-type glycerol-3-phosphate transport system substrate-binding protein